MDENGIAKVVVDLAVQIHQELGPGLLESVYETTLAHELRERGLDARRQVAVPIRYHNIVFDEGLRADIVVEDKVLVELKCVVRIHPAHRKQVLSYLRLTDLKLGLLLNFGESLMRNGISRVVNGLEGQTIEAKKAQLHLAQNTSSSPSSG